MARLPSKLRTTLELFYWGGLTESEIASLSGRPIGTVASRIRRAKVKLKAFLHNAM
jgi:DNA-directed RNA polymerase specialized sigma24 family protein